MCRSLAAHMQISIEWKLYTISSKREFKLQITIQHSLDICIIYLFFHSNSIATDFVLQTVDPAFFHFVDSIEN